jgi:hypothetical protein
MFGQVGVCGGMCVNTSRTLVFSLLAGGWAKAGIALKADMPARPAAQAAQPPRNCRLDNSQPTLSVFSAFFDCACWSFDFIKTSLSFYRLSVISFRT